MSDLSTPKTYVYLVRQGESHLYKIGFTFNPKQRLRQLQTSNAAKLTFVHLWTESRLPEPTHSAPTGAALVSGIRRPFLRTVSGLKFKR